MSIKNTILAVILLSPLLLQGCMVAAIGAGIGAVKYANAKKTEARADCSHRYNEYVKLMMKSGKQPMDIAVYCNDK